MRLTILNSCRPSPADPIKFYVLRKFDADSQANSLSLSLRYCGEHVAEMLEKRHRPIGALQATNALDLEPFKRRVN